MPNGSPERERPLRDTQDFSTVSIPRITPEMVEQARRQAPPQPDTAATGQWEADRLAAQRLAQSAPRRRRGGTAQARPPYPGPDAMPAGDTTTTFAMPEAYRMAEERTPPAASAPAPLPAWQRWKPRERKAAPAPAAPKADLTMTSTALKVPEEARPNGAPAAAGRPAAEAAAKPAAAEKPAPQRRTHASRARAEAALYQSIHDDHLWLNNPVMVRGLGLAPAVVAVTSAGSALQLCAAAALLLTATRVLAVALCHLLGGRQRPLLYAFCGAVVYIPAYCVLYKLFGADLTLLGIYLPLLVTDPVIIKRMEAPELETVPQAFRRGINNTLGLCLALMLLGILRELLGAGTVFGFTVIRRAVLPLASQPAGGFMLMGLAAAVWTAIGGSYVRYKQEEVRHLYAEHRQ